MFINDVYQTLIRINGHVRMPARINIKDALGMLFVRLFTKRAFSLKLSFQVVQGITSTSVQRIFLLHYGCQLEATVNSVN